MLGTLWVIWVRENHPMVWKSNFWSFDSIMERVYRILLRVYHCRVVRGGDPNCTRQHDSVVWTKFTFASCTSFDNNIWFLPIHDTRSLDTNGRLVISGIYVSMCVSGSEVRVCGFGWWLQALRRRGGVRKVTGKTGYCDSQNMHANSCVNDRWQLRT